MPNPGRVTRVQTTVAAVVIGLVGGLVLAEAGAWFYDQYLDRDKQRARLFRRQFPTDHGFLHGRIPFFFKPGSEGRYVGVPIRINQEGFRDREIGARQDGELRIAVIGDSIVFGHGLSQDDTLSHRLETMLNHGRDAGRPRVAVYNFGIPGSTSYEQYLVAQKVADLGFDRVIWVYYLNDPIFESFNRDIQECGIEVPWRYRIERVLQRSHFVDLAANRLDLVMARIRYGFPSPFFAAHEAGQPGFECVRRSVKAAADLFKARGIPALFTVYPMPAVVGPGYPFRTLHHKMITMAEEDGFVAQDLSPVFERVTPEQVMLSKLDRHPNGFANGLAAEAIADDLRRRGLLDAVTRFRETGG